MNALALDPDNVPLRRELAYLYLAMHKDEDAKAQFQKLLTIDPTDSLSQKQLKSLVKVQPVAAAAVASAKQIGEKSLLLGYANEAIKYLRQAHEDDPDDEAVILKLGWAYNYAHEDGEAVKWFDRARHASDPAVATEAEHAYHNLTSSGTPQFSTWALPMYSTRWHDLFAYSQAKKQLPIHIPGVSFYLSTRVIGDVKSTLPQPAMSAQYLSESAFVLGVGASSHIGHYMTAWAEAGESFSYLLHRTSGGTALPDYRGGLSAARGFGHSIASSKDGFFYDVSGDAVYVSRYSKDWIFVGQQHAGWTLHANSATLQFLANLNLNQDLKNQYWAEALEFGPGARIHMNWMPPGVYFSTDLLHGVYTNNTDNPRRPNYNDVRVGFWYSFAK